LPNRALLHRRRDERRHGAIACPTNESRATPRNADLYDGVVKGHAAPPATSANEASEPLPTSVFGDPQALSAIVRGAHDVHTVDSAVADGGAPVDYSHGRQLARAIAVRGEQQSPRPRRCPWQLLARTNFNAPVVASK